MALGVTAMLLFILGFLTGYFAISNNEPSYIDTRRGKMVTGGKLQKKEEYLSTFYKSLNKREIVNHLHPPYFPLFQPDTHVSIEELRRNEMQQKDEDHFALYRSLSKTDIQNNLEYFSRRPHIAGTARSKELADEIARTWREYNFDKVEMPKYNILLPYADPSISNKVQILDTGNNIVVEFSGKEKVIS